MCPIRTRVAAAAMLVFCACNGGSSASGTVDGVTIVVNDGFSFHQTVPGFLPDGGDGIFLAGFVLTDLTGVCALLAAHRDPPNITALSVEVADGQPISAGTYAIQQPSGTPRFAASAFSRTDGACNSVISANATGGSVTFSSLSSSQATGTFDLTYPDAGHLTGTFSTPECLPFDAELQAMDAGTRCG
jgi:hypothetical protein